SAEECSATNLCESGCCSKYGFCGFGDDHCGSGCLSTCDAIEDDGLSGGGSECSASVPCKVGCCSKYGNCGYGEDYCSKGKGCVNNCGLKSECDAGWGLDWAESKKCPLNVCCSKYGFCGTTEDFCGEKDKVDRPSCSVGSQSINRVVGYYEEWSEARPCGGMIPEGIPAGYYTHINFAFANIDPDTFAITASADRDDELWRRVQSLRLEQPGVEIWIALGGWVFNDAEQPTATTFSDIAGSEINQKLFAKSLLAMMSTYGFDGVDIDWEYPVAEDRSGRKADFHNFPKWMKNLRSQLHSSGKEYGLSLTLPASFWYLQHFDVKELEDAVDWFNIMTYDIHGTWDMNNTWVGPFLNPHTNLTEVKGAMDLLWRNDIDPSKVTMGLAFYGRGFTLASPDCAEPGCTYLSGGNAGQCSETIGFLLNSEIQTIIDDNNLTPKFYEEDAVKAVSFGDQWVSYDDADTFKIRGDFAKSQCLGGVMVWAISHDNNNHSSAKALTRGLGRERMDFPDYPKAVSTSSTASDSSAQLSSRSLTKRADNDKNVDVCGATAEKTAQVDGNYPDFVFASSNGAGGEQVCHTGAKSFCCKKDATPWQFKKCDWKKKATHRIKSDVFCEASCPDGSTRLGMHMGDCMLSWEAYCCEGDPPVISKPEEDDPGNDDNDDDDDTKAIEPRDPKQQYYSQYKSLIERYMTEPGAPDDWQSSSWSGDNNDDKKIGLWDKRSILVLESFELLNAYTARTVETMLEETTYLWDVDGPAAEYGEAFLIESMNGVIADSGYTLNTYAYVSDMTANPNTANDGMQYLNSAASYLCEVADSSGSAKRDLEGGYKGVERGTSLDRRHINVLGAYGNLLLFQPTIEDILDGILNSALTLQYARWEHYNDNNHGARAAQPGPFLELAYWIGSTVGVLGSNAHVYQEDPSDRWVVFHIHTINDVHTHIPSEDTDNPFMGVTHITAYHGQRVGQRYRGGNLRIENRDTRRHNDGSYVGNTRSSPMECPTDQRWYVGSLEMEQVPLEEHMYAVTLQQWGESLRTMGYLAREGYSVLYNGFAPDYTNYRRNGRGIGVNFLIYSTLVNDVRYLSVQRIGDAGLQ
ncbi:hypothetical protein N7471_008291, partial [Penicillium samsonianum]|uniref:uncharacterized protein n=1 Tax=Penicillium samsonianum TaxID=1882272 RepID=UPI002548AF2D